MDSEGINNWRPSANRTPCDRMVSFLLVGNLNSVPTWLWYVIVSIFNSSLNITLGIPLKKKLSLFKIKNLKSIFIYCFENFIFIKGV
jgi:hypothetical protein